MLAVRVRISMRDSTCTRKVTVELVDAKLNVDEQVGTSDINSEQVGTTNKKDFWPVLAMLLFVVRRIRASVLLFEYSAVRLKLCRSNPKTLRIESSDSTNLTVQYCRSENFFEQHPPSIFPASKVYRLLAGGRLVLEMAEGVE